MTAAVVELGPDRPRVVSALRGVPLDVSPGRLAGARIVVLDDRPLLAQSLRVALEVEGAQVMALALRPAGIAPGVIAAMVDAAPDLVVLAMDPVAEFDELVAMMPGFARGGARVLVLAADTEPVRLGAAIESGAAGLISVCDSLEIVVHRTQLARAGLRVRPQQQQIEARVAWRRFRVSQLRRHAPFDALSSRESDVLRALICGWTVARMRDELCITEATARSHVRAILHKLGVHSQLAAVALAHEVGWGSCRAMG